MTGCDTVSFFCGVGKHAFYKAWTTDEETNAFYCLSHPQDNQLSAEIVIALVKFVCKAYGVKGEEGLCLTTARKHLFATLGRPVNKIPPSKGCFEMHLLRSAYQSGQIWGRALHVEKPECPSQWGRRLVGGQWQPIWSTQDAIWSKVQALYKCGCQSGCATMRCNCRRNGLNCILACKICKGDCENKKKDANLLPEDPEEDVDGDV
ncbi:1-deoxypentalenic acid 11-beta-hydroxylase [Frankliniella fusca]|uniref:1-deoxypentalenic acid 11-beta-hydroxylase n=1 Tax=Frankliniella fusca TaxID=407009 RepID=A0AAE1LE09_9NEOP|nr:1-deoxypentalenic acid 11-beta-hydroxylase [Frankliniella fusca]